MSLVLGILLLPVVVAFRNSLWIYDGMICALSVRGGAEAEAFLLVILLSTALWLVYDLPLILLVARWGMIFLILYSFSRLIVVRRDVWKVPLIYLAIASSNAFFHTLAGVLASAKVHWSPFSPEILLATAVGAIGGVVRWSREKRWQ